MPWEYCCLWPPASAGFAQITVTGFTRLGERSLTGLVNIGNWEVRVTLPLIGARTAVVPFRPSSSALDGDITCLDGEKT